MKLIRVITIVSTVTLSVFCSASVAQDLSATRPRRVKELQPQVPRGSLDSQLASMSNAPERESLSEDLAPLSEDLAPWVRSGKAESQSLNEPSLDFYSPWIGRLKLDSASSYPLGANAITIGTAADPHIQPAPPPSTSGLSARPGTKVHILSPQSNDRFALKQITVSIKVDDPAIENLELLITKNETDSANDKIIYDSGPMAFRVTSGSWRRRIELPVGRFTIEAIGRDKDGKRIDDDKVSEVKREAGSPHDVRGPFEASFYLGYGIDTFAASELRKYLNPDANKVEERIVGGFDFSYRLFGDPMKSRGHQLWVYGETVHGVRSADLDCTANPDQPLCKDLLNGQNPDPGSQLVAILRKATSLEAFAGIRWEFSAINGADDSPARAYLKSQFGFVTVAGLGGDVVDLHQYVALGLTSTRGKYRNSYFEIGYGKSDFFLDNRNKRWKIDGFLSWGSASTEGVASLMRPFAQITVDSDFGKGSDSIQTYIGIDFDISFLWKKP